MPILLSEERDGTLLLTLNRPEAHNAISSGLALQLAAKLEEVAERREIRSLPSCGRGEGQAT